MPEVYENYMVLQTISKNQDYSLYGNEFCIMDNQDNGSPFGGSQGSSIIASPMSSSLSPLHCNDYISLKNATEPYLTILEQPMEKFRFRYKSEMIGTHGSLVASTSGGGGRKKYSPSVQLHNFSENAIVRCTLVTSNEGQRIPHAHRLVRRDGGVDCDDPHHVKVTPETGFIATFHGMGIIHTAKKHVRDELIRKMRVANIELNKRKCKNGTLSTREEAQIKADAEFYQKCVNLNSVALCFQAFILDKNDVMIPVTAPVYSNAINNLKSALTGELKICRIDKYTSHVEGGEEVFILVEKVGKKNIKIKFFELNEDDFEIWCDYGRFSELDVHHQYAIAFRTPPYKDLNITTPKQVYIQLERPSDADCSEPIKFTYKPSDRIIGKKRQRMSYSGSAELSHVISTLNNTGTENIPDNFNSTDSREISKELKRFLSEGCKTPIWNEFITDIDLDGYLKLIDNSEGNMLTSDGPSNRQHQDDIMFAQNMLIEAIECLKKDSKNAEVHIRKLLKDRSTYGDSPLHAALRYGQRDVVKYILMLISIDKHCKMLINGQNSSGKTPLHYAVLQNQPEITKALLVLGADPNQSDEHGFSPLHSAVRVPEAGLCVDALLSEKITDIEAHNDTGWTPLQLAAEAGSYDAVCSLVQAGANVNNTEMSYGRTALHIAVEGGHKDIVEYLLKETSIDINKRNFSGNTALHTAVAYSGARANELCALLIQHGADPHIQNHNRESNNVDERNGLQVDVKMEVQSDDENTEGTTGQSSFHLAMNKPDIFQLLSGQGKEVTNSEMSFVSTKLEVEEDDFQISWLNNERKEKLSKILDKTQGWKNLAQHLNYEYFLKTLQHVSSSPSLFLLNYIDVHASLSLTDMETILRDIGEEEAANYVNENSSTYSQNAYF